MKRPANFSPLETRANVMKGRILVTGGAGFIGSHLVDHLVEQGERVTVLDDLSTGIERNLQQARACGDVQLVIGSILDAKAVEAAIAGCDRIFHLAVQCVRRSLGKPLENHEINATGTLQMLEAARRAKASRFVYCSSSEVYGNANTELMSETETVCEPTTVYAAAKLAGESYSKAYHRTYGLPTIIVRPFNAFGPREHDQDDLAEVIPRFVIRVLNGQPPIIFGDGSNGRDFTYVTDTARGLALAATCDALVGREVNVAFGRMVRIGEVADSILRICQVRDQEPIFAPARPGDVRSLHADTKLAREVLGFKATIPFEEGLERYLAWFNSTYPDPSRLPETSAQNWAMPGEGSEAQ
jgi:UDP-glucose 4-epimerase